MGIEMRVSFFERFLKINQNYLRLDSIGVNFVRFMTVAQFEWGYLIETEHTSEEGVITLEVLVCKDRKIAVLIHRERFGVAHDDMRPYPRDSQYPIGHPVRLIHDV